jgi:hypothetical protein
MIHITVLKTSKQYPEHYYVLNTNISLFWDVMLCIVLSFGIQRRVVR